MNTSMRLSSAQPVGLRARRVMVTQWLSQNIPAPRSTVSRRAARAVEIGLQDAGAVAPMEAPECTAEVPQASPLNETDWNEWYLLDLSKNLSGIECGTSRVKVTTREVIEAEVVKSSEHFLRAQRAEEVEVVLQFEAVHKAEGDKTVIGETRIKFGRDEFGRDNFKLLSIKMDTSALEHEKSQGDVQFAVEHTLGSAILMSLNDFLWSVESSLESLSQERR